MIGDLLKSPLRLHKCIRPADYPVTAPQVNCTRLAHRDRRQRQECDTSAIFALQIGDGSLRCIRILRDDIAHAPAERHVNCREIALRDADEIGDRSGDIFAPTLLCLQDNLHIPPEAFIAVLHAPLKIKALPYAQELRIRLPQLRLITINRTTKVSNLCMKLISFLRELLHLLLREVDSVIDVREFALRRRKEILTPCTLLLLLPVLLRMRRIPSDGKLLPQTRQYPLYGMTGVLLLRHVLLLARNDLIQPLGRDLSRRLLRIFFRNLSAFAF